jgi:hypothetical protein
MKRSNNAQILVKYRLHCLWAGQCEPEIEVERVPGWIFPTGSLPENPDPARFTASEIEVLRRMTDNVVSTTRRLGLRMGGYR